MKAKFLAILGLCLCVVLAHAQKTAIVLDKDQQYKTGIELFEQKKYGASLKVFRELTERISDTKSLLRIDAEFYAAASAIELFHKDGEWHMRKFIEEHPENPKVIPAHFYLGKSSFRKKKYSETIEHLEKVEVYGLSREELAELYFKRGYSYLENNINDKAKNDLNEIRNSENKYAHPANYYYSHLCYLEKNYAVALEGFLKLLDNETFGPVVPYYIAQIYFQQKKYDDVIKVAPQLLNDSIQAQKKDEINRIIAESYYAKKEFSAAIPYFKNYSPRSPFDHFQIGYCYYKTSQWDDAIKQFQDAIINEDTIAQNAWYHIGDVYLKKNDKNKARNAFYKAFNFSFNPFITEDAMYNYARLSYETGFSPFNEAISTFRKYIQTYPQSSRRDEAYTYLVNCFYSTKNYKQAMRMIEQMESPDLQLKTIYQKLAYSQAVEFYNNAQIDSAKKYFEKALTNPMDALTSALSKYWLGEISYLRKEYSSALLLWKEFQMMPGSFNSKEYDLANYNIGYAYLMNKQYSDAQISFRKYLGSKNNTDQIKAADANVRTADAYFMGKDYSAAADHYETAIALSKTDIDYCLYQKGICNGLLKNYKEKINDLTALEKGYPNSAYVLSSIYEIAESYKTLSQWEEALKYYSKIINEHSGSAYVSRSLISCGMIHYNNKQDQKAFEFLDKMVKLNPKSEEAQSVLPVIKDIFKNLGKLEERDQYLASMGMSMDQSQAENDYFEKASQSYYVEKNCDKAFPELQNYLSKYPEGKYSTEANFCMAECAFSKNDFVNALKGYRFVLSKNRSVQTEVALVKASYILFKDKNYAEALPYYLQLEINGENPTNKLNATIGAMRCGAYLTLNDTVVIQANKLLVNEKASNQQKLEARILKARALYAMNKHEEALLDFKYLSRNAKSEVGAESYYYTALILKDKKEFKEAEKTIYSLVNYEYSNNDWNTKGMLLASKIYIDKGDDASAEATLQTIIENADKQEFIDEAKQLLDKIKKDREEKTKAAQQSSEPMKIKFENTDENNKLFDNNTTPVIANDTLLINPGKNQ